MNTFEKVAAAIADSKGLELSAITTESTFQDLGIDSLDVAELVMSLEDEFGITIELDENVKTVADMVKIIDEAK